MSFRFTLSQHLGTHNLHSYDIYNPHLLTKSPFLPTHESNLTPLRQHRHSRLPRLDPSGSNPTRRPHAGHSSSGRHPRTRVRNTYKRFGMCSIRSNRRCTVGSVVCVEDHIATCKIEAEENTTEGFERCKR